MIPKQEILNKLRRIKADLQPFGVTRIGMFGSVLRNSSHKDSDIDLLIYFNDASDNTENFNNTCGFLEGNFKGYKLDIVTEKSLSPFVVPFVLNEVEFI